MHRKNGCDMALCNSCGTSLLASLYSPTGYLCGWCRAQREARSRTHQRRQAAAHRQVADRLAASAGLRACLCGRSIRWAYEYCWWCREALAREDAGAEGRDANDNRTQLGEHSKRTPGVYDYNNMRIEVLPRNPDGTLSECDNYSRRSDTTPDGWW